MLTLYLIFFVLFVFKALQFIREDLVANFAIFIHHTDICSKKIYSRKWVYYHLWISGAYGRRRAR